MSANARRFVILDPSLVGLGGHEWEYASLMLEQARRAGYSVQLLSNRSVSIEPDDSVRTPPLPTFSFNTYAFFAWVNPGDRLARNEATEPGLRGLYQSYRLLKKRRRYVRKATAECEQVLRDLSLQPDDVVFVPTLNELELDAFSGAIKRCGLQGTRWAFQFHFDFLAGTRSRSSRARRTAKMRRLTQVIQKRLQGQRVAFFSTTETLAEQFNSLQHLTVRELPYPVAERNTASIATDPSVADGRLRVVCAGADRAEKGLDRVFQTIAELHRRDRLNRFEFVLQCDPSRGEAYPELMKSGCVAFMPHPLSKPDYQSLLDSADIGLMLYDPQIYQSRRAGVLSELLVRGVPSVVSAGSWLASQLVHPSEWQNRSPAPRGLGLSAASPSQAADALCEIQQTWSQWTAYQRPSADSFRDFHDPANSLQQLLDGVHADVAAANRGHSMRNSLRSHAA